MDNELTAWGQMAWQWSQGDNQNGRRVPVTVPNIRDIRVDPSMRWSLDVAF